jgi:hypothetical protein
MTRNTISGISPQEAAFIRSQLNLRYNQQQSCWEVFTTVHGSGGIFKWIKCQEETARWYIEQFPHIIKQMDMTSRGLLEEVYHR